ncbi:MAG: hypothetical protein ACTHK8_03425 [Ginsengibacter sp.]
MKKKWSIVRLQLRSISIAKKQRRNRHKKKLRNIEVQKRKKINADEKIIRNRNKKSRVENIKIDAGFSFSLFQEPENVIRIIESLERCKTKSKYLKVVQIELSNIKQIDMGAISFLLAKVHEMSQLKAVKIWGTVPKDESCKEVFNTSGFLDYMRDLGGNKFKKHSENFIFKVGTDRTNNQKVGRTIEKAMKFLTGIEQKFPPVYSIVQEICSNSVEWANAPETRNKNWFLSVNYPQGNNLVEFTMTDIGYGILHTLNRRFARLISETLKLTKDDEILYRAFERKYSSKTNETNRNRGLPLIKDRFERSFVKRMRVITNNVFLDFEDSNKTRLLSKNLPGTFYTWQVDLNCLEKWEQQQLN